MELPRPAVDAARNDLGRPGSLPDRWSPLEPPTRWSDPQDLSRRHGDDDDESARTRDTLPDDERTSLLAAASAIAHEEPAGPIREPHAAWITPPRDVSVLRPASRARQEDLATAIHKPVGPVRRESSPTPKRRRRSDGVGRTSTARSPTRRALPPMSWLAVCGGTFVGVLLGGMVVLGGWLGGG